MDYITSHLLGGWGADVPIRAILNNHGPSFEPEDIEQLTAAFEAALSKLGLIDRTDPVTTTVATLIIEVAKTGERDAKKLCDNALKILGK
jgi:hypothetical protein